MTLHGSFNCEFNRYIFKTLNGISTPINSNGNISHEGILKYSKFRRCDSFVSFFLFTVTVNRLLSKSLYVLGDNRIYNVFVIFLMCFFTIFSSSQLDLPIEQISLLITTEHD